MTKRTFILAVIDALVSIVTILLPRYVDTETVKLVRDLWLVSQGVIVPAILYLFGVDVSEAAARKLGDRMLSSPGSDGKDD